MANGGIFIGGSATDAAGRYLAARWTAAGVVTSLGLLSGATPTVGNGREAFGITGTGSDIFVQRLRYDEAQAISLFGSEVDSRIVWHDPVTLKWLNAVDGNAGGAAFNAGLGAYDPVTDFYPGWYGVDTATNAVWAVLNHNSSFAVGELLPAVPEAGTGLFGLAAAVVLGCRRNGSAEAELVSPYGRSFAKRSRAPVASTIGHVARSALS